MAEKIKIDARVDIETVEKINQLAVQQNRTKSGMIAHILNEYVKGLPKPNDYQTK